MALKGLGGIIGRLRQKPTMVEKARAPHGLAQTAARLGVGAPPAFTQPMNQIQVPDLSRKLVTRYGIREKAPAPTLASEVVPVVLVDDLIGESDLIRPRIRPCAGAISLAAAASTPCGGLFNPAGSRVVCHILYLGLTASLASDVDIHFTGTPATGATGSTGFRNGLLPAQTPVGQMVGNVGAASPGGAIEWKTRITAAAIIIPFDCVLDENQALQVRVPVAANPVLFVSMAWTEEDKG